MNIDYFKSLAINGGALMALDYPFLMFITTYFYNDLVPRLTGVPFNVEMNIRNIASIAIAYLAMTLGLKELAVDDRSAALLGLVIYGVYSFTNMVVFQSWDWRLAVIETLWGGLLYFMARRLVIYLQGMF